MVRKFTFVYEEIIDNKNGSLSYKIKILKTNQNSQNNNKNSNIYQIITIIQFSTITTERKSLKPIMNQNGPCLTFLKKILNSN
jgi:hypothetical protein